MAKVTVELLLFLKFKEEIGLDSSPEQMALFGTDQLIKCRPNLYSEDLDFYFFKKGIKSQIQNSNFSRLKIRQKIMINNHF